MWADDSWIEEENTEEFSLNESFWEEVDGRTEIYLDSDMSIEFDIELTKKGTLKKIGFCNNDKMEWKDILTKLEEISGREVEDRWETEVLYGSIFDKFRDKVEHLQVKSVYRTIDKLSPAEFILLNSCVVLMRVEGSEVYLTNFRYEGTDMYVTLVNIYGEIIGHSKLLTMGELMEIINNSRILLNLKEDKAIELLKKYESQSDFGIIREQEDTYCSDVETNKYVLYRDNKDMLEVGFKINTDDKLETLVQINLNELGWEEAIKVWNKTKHKQICYSPEELKDILIGISVDDFYSEMYEVLSQGETLNLKSFRCEQYLVLNTCTVVKYLRESVTEAYNFRYIDGKRYYSERTEDLEGNFTEKLDEIMYCEEKEGTSTEECVSLYGYEIFLPDESLQLDYLKSLIVK